MKNKSIKQILPFLIFIFFSITIVFYFYFEKKKIDFENQIIVQKKLEKVGQKNFLFFNYSCIKKSNVELINYLNDEYKNFEIEKKLSLKYIISKFNSQKHYNNIFYDYKSRKNYFVLSFNFKPQMSKNMILYFKKDNFIVLDVNQINNEKIKLPYVKYKNFLILEKEPSKIDNRINIFVRYFDEIVPNIISYKFKNKNFDFSELSDCTNQINQTSLFKTKEMKTKSIISSKINKIDENLETSIFNINLILLSLLIIFVLFDTSNTLTYLSIYCLINLYFIIHLNFDLKNIYYTLFYCLFIYLFLSLKEIYYKMND